MTDMARWGPKRFYVSPSQIIPFQNLNTSLSLKTDSENDTSGRAQTNTRGLELQPLSFSTTYHKATGSDPRAQWDEWASLVGLKYPLYIGGKRFGPASFILQAIGMGETVISDSGEMTSLTINFTLEEDAQGQTSTMSGMSTLDENTRAMNATASAADRARMAPR